MSIHKFKSRSLGCACLSLLLAPAVNCSAAEEWESIHLKNGIISLQIVPEIGGRVLRFSLGNYQYLTVNKALENQPVPESRLGPDGEWLNYGGDKLWTAPQGWSGDHEWPGPPDVVLDGGPYEAKIVKRKRNKPVAVELISEKDPRSGVQLSRVIRIFDNSSRVSFDAKIKNIDSKPRRWGIWPHTQLNAKNRHGKGFNPNYHAYCPINPKSKFAKGYGVIFGLAQNQSYKPDYESGIMELHYQRRVGKIGMDSDAGWVACYRSSLS